ncbi:negative elongation factor E-like isoform X2 [Acanthaster planci]|nr:negative elongation factor E-like isoform X2 [Acanthaster planci]
MKLNKSKPAPITPQDSLKRPAAEMSQEDAKEKAKSVLAAQQAKQAKLEENKSSGFKRSRKLQRSLKEPEKVQALPSFQPFVSPNSGPSSGEELSPGPVADSRRLHRKSLQESFISSRSTSQPDTPDGTPEKKRGNTIYVHGYGISHEVCDKAFKGIGTISNINVELEKSCAFITFDDIDAADRAIEEMNEKMVSGVRLHVSLARRQRNVHRFNSSDSAQTAGNSQWANLAMGNLKGVKHKDKREMQVYGADDDLFL